MKRLILCVLILFAACACNPYENPLESGDSGNEILIYSGITMADAVLEIANIFESENKCKVSVMYGASGYLKRVIEVNRKGDIFFPGDKSYIDDLHERHVVTRTVEVGYNKLAFFVQTGNPMHLNGSLSQLLDKRLKVVLGARNAGSVGQETYHLLSSHGIYEKAALNVSFFTADSKGLASAIRDREADLTINWRAIGFNAKNRGKVDMIEIESENIRRVPIVMGLLTYSTHNSCSERFLDLAKSSAGAEIFRKYGFID